MLLRGKQVNNVFLGCQKCQVGESNKCLQRLLQSPIAGILMRLDVSEPVLVAGHWLGRIKLSLALQLAFFWLASACLL